MTCWHGDEAGKCPDCNLVALLLIEEEIENMKDKWDTYCALTCLGGSEERILFLLGGRRGVGQA